MNSFLKILITAGVLLSIVYPSDLHVNLLNGTSNSQGYADRVALIDLSKGMAEMASANDVSGSTTFSGISSGGQTQYLIQAHYDGIKYSTTIVPSAEVTAWEASITVYDKSDAMNNVHASVPFFVIYAFEDRLYVQKRLILENHSNPPLSFSDTPGVIGVHVPENVTEMDYITFKNGSMPLKTQVIKSGDGQVIPNPLKPGKSEIDIAYYLPYESSSAVVSEKIDWDINHYHVYVMPMHMKISAPGLSREGSDNENGLAIYSIETIAAGTTLEFDISGEGMSETAPQEQQQQQQRGRIVIEHRLGQNTELLVAGVLILIILAALMISLNQQGADIKQVSVDILKKQKQSMLKEYAALDTGDEKTVEKEKLLHRLLSVYKTLDRIK